MKELLLRGGTVLDETGAVRPACDLLLRDGKIAAVGSALPATGCEEVDCTGLYITPGFAVLHAHSPMHILRGLAEDVHIDDWFNTEIFPYESLLLPDDLYWGARLCVAEMLDNGITAFADHYFGAEQVAAAVLDGGIRCDLAVTAFGQNGLQADVDETLRIRDRFAGNDRLQVRFGPHSPYLCGPELLRGLCDAARSSGMGVHLHISETREQVEQSYQKQGKSPFAVAAAAGCFALPCIAAHGLWVEESDLALLSENTFVPVSPKTYLKLGMGAGGLWQLHDRINLCIGTDGAASSNTVDALEQLRLFGLVGKWQDKATQFPVDELWRILMNGHRALGFGSGRIVVGAAADLNVWDLDSPATTPVYNPLATLIYSASPVRNLRHTLVGGAFAKRDGKLTQNVAEVVAQAKRCAAGILARGKGQTELAF